MFQMVLCSECGITFPKEQKEYNRRIRVSGINARFFCKRKCAGMHINREKQKPVIQVTCECGNVFLTTENTYCSRSCASKYSMTPERLNAMILAGRNSGTHFTSNNLDAIANSLRVREWEKYSYIHDILIDLFIPHYFEYPLTGTKYIFDLALYDFNAFIEFDEKYHNEPQQLLSDNEKTNIANSMGWNVFRISTIQMQSPYPVSLLSQFIEYYI